MPDNFKLWPLPAYYYHADLDKLAFDDESRYSQTGPGEAVPARAFQQKSCFKSTTDDSVGFQSKLVVITDYTAPFWSDNKMREVVSFCKYLLSKKVTIGIWQDDEKEKIKILDENSVSCLREKEIRDKVTPTDDIEVLKAACKIRSSLRREGLLILNNNLLEYELARIKNLQEKAPEEPLSQPDCLPTLNYLKSSHVQPFFDDPDFITIFTRITEDAFNKGAVLIKDHFDSRKDTSWHARFESIKISYCILNLNEEELNTLIETGRIVSTDGEEFKIEHLANITELHLEYALVKISHITYLLKTAERLRILKIEACEYTADTIFKIDFLPFLRILHIGGHPAQGEPEFCVPPFLMKGLLVASADKLEELLLRRSEFSDLETVHFSSLRMLKLSPLYGKGRFSITGNTLKELSLDCNSETLFLDFEQSNLEILAINCRSFAAGCLKKLLTVCAPNLTELTLYQARYEKESFIPSDTIFFIKKLNIAHSSISSNVLSELLTATASTVEKMILDADSFSKAPISPINFPALRELYTTTRGAKIIPSTVLHSAPALEVFFMAQALHKYDNSSFFCMPSLMPLCHASDFPVRIPQVKRHLETSTVQRVSYDSDEDDSQKSLSAPNIVHSFIVSQHSLFLLKSAQIYQTSFQNLANFITPSLQCGNLAWLHCTKMDFRENNWDSLNLRSLSELSFDVCTLTAENIAQIASTAVGLKGLTLSDSEIVGDFTADVDLSSLTYIYLNGGYNNYKTVEKFLQATPNLRYFYFSNPSVSLSLQNPKLYSLLENIQKRGGIVHIEDQNFKVFQGEISKLRRSLASLPPSDKISDVQNCLDLYLKDGENPFLRQSLHNRVIIWYKEFSPQFSNPAFHRSAEPRTSGLSSASPSTPSLPAPAPHSASPFFKRPNTHFEPKHNVETYKDYTPSTMQSPYEENSLNQDLIIAKVIKYLEVTQQNAEWIPKLYGGICNALAHTFVRVLSTKQWAGWKPYIDSIISWDGEKDTLSPELEENFKSLLKDIEQYQLMPFPTKKIYLGDNLFTFLNGLTINLPVYLENCWHTIVLIPIGNQNYIIYNPNFRKEYWRCVTEENLRTELTDQLGTLILVAERDISLSASMHDKASFIREGGLLALCEIDNAGEVLAQLTSADDYLLEDLEGIFLRDVDGMPAWLVGLFQTSNPNIHRYTINLLLNFLEYDVNICAKKIQHSVAVLSQIQKYYYIQLLRNKKTDSRYTRYGLEVICAMIQETLLEAVALPAPALLTTTPHEPSTSEGLQQYCERILTTETKNILIEVNRRDAVNLCTHLESFASASYPVFRVNRSGELVCSGTVIRQDPDSDRVNFVDDPAGSPLGMFLNRGAHAPFATLLINLTGFTSKQIVAMSSVFINRYIDNLPIVNNIKIVCVIGHQTLPEDLYQYFQQVEPCPISSRVLEETLPPLPIRQKTSDDVVNPQRVINLHPDSFLTQLTGSWQMRADGSFKYIEAKFLAMLLGDGPIQINTALWSHEKFQQFWQRAWACRRIYNGEKTVPLPAHLEILTSDDDYNWPALTAGVRFETGLRLAQFEEEIPVFNTTVAYEMTANRFVYDDETQTHLLSDSWLKKYASSELHVNVTRTLPDYEWVKLFEAAQAEKVQLIMHCAPSVTLPKALQAALQPGHDTLQYDACSYPHTLIYDCQDVDAAEAILTSAEDWEKFDVSESKISDLFLSISVQRNPEKNGFTFSATPGVVSKYLKERKKVILKGHFSTALADGIASFILGRLANPSTASGQLLIISEDKKSFDYLGSPYRLNDDMKKQLLIDEFGGLVDHLSSALIQTESYARLRTRLSYLAADDSHDPLTGKQDFLLAKSKEEESVERLEHPQLAYIHALMDRGESFIVVLGPTGSGKTTTLKKIASHVGAENLEKFLSYAQKNLHKRCVLLIDEGNLQNRQWCEFSGLFYKEEKKVFYNQKHEAWPPNAFVISTGNPANDGRGRNVPRAWRKYACFVHWDSLPRQSVLEQTLLPLFENTPLASQANLISEKIMAVYDFFCKRSSDEILISPRELQQIVLSVLKDYTEGQDLQVLTTQAIYLITKNLVPKKYKDVFEKYFSPSSFSQRDTFCRTLGLCMFSQQFALHQLRNFLSTRAYQYREFQTGGEAQKYGGLGGVVIEGEKEADELKFTLDALELCGVRRIDPQEMSGLDLKKETCHMAYICVEARMSLENKTALLLQAWDAGIIVVMENFNSTNVSDELLYALLMGKDPNDNPPERLGFALIGATKSLTSEGREQLGAAMERRLLQIKLPALSSYEKRGLDFINVPQPPDADAYSYSEEENDSYSHSSEEDISRDHEEGTKMSRSVAAVHAVGLLAASQSSGPAPAPASAPVAKGAG